MINHPLNVPSMLSGDHGNCKILYSLLMRYQCRLSWQLDCEGISCWKMRDQDSPDVESGGALNTDVEINTWHIPEYCWFSCFCVCKFVFKD